MSETGMAPLGAAAGARIVARVADLLFRAKIAETGKLLGVGVEVSPAGAGVVGEADGKAGGVALLIVDLGLRDADPFELIRAARAENPALTIVAYGSHVDTAALERARAAGATRVLPRSAFSRDLASILKGAVAGETP